MSLAMSLRVSLANLPHPFTQKKQYTLTRTAFGDGNSKRESNQGPQSPFQGQRNLLMKEDFFKKPKLEPSPCPRASI